MSAVSHLSLHCHTYSATLHSVHCKCLLSATCPFTATHSTLPHHPQYIATVCCQPPVPSPLHIQCHITLSTLQMSAVSHLSLHLYTYSATLHSIHYNCLLSATCPVTVTYIAPHYFQETIRTIFCSLCYKNHHTATIQIAPQLLCRLAGSLALFVLVQVFHHQCDITVNCQYRRECFAWSDSSRL